MITSDGISKDSRKVAECRRRRLPLVAFLGDSVGINKSCAAVASPTQWGFGKLAIHDFTAILARERRHRIASFYSKVRRRGLSHTLSSTVRSSAAGTRLCSIGLLG